MTLHERCIQHILGELKGRGWTPYATDHQPTVDGVRALERRGQIEVCDLGFIKLKPKDITP